MPRTNRTTRKSISIRGVTYQRLKDQAAARETGASTLLEEFLEEKFKALGVPPETVLDGPPAAEEDPSGAPEVFTY